MGTRGPKKKTQGRTLVANPTPKTRKGMQHRTKERPKASGTGEVGHTVCDHKVDISISISSCDHKLVGGSGGHRSQLMIRILYAVGGVVANIAV